MVAASRFIESRNRWYGHGPRTICSTPDGHRKRFEVLSEIGDLVGWGIIHIGCGLGRLCEFLPSHVRNLADPGFDISPTVLSRARKEHPGVSSSLFDTTAEPLRAYADYLLASGVPYPETARTNSQLQG